MGVDDSLSEHFSHPTSEQIARATSGRVEVYDSNHFDSSVAAIGQFLRGAGLGLRLEWLSSCLSSLGDAIPGFVGLNLAEKSRMCFEQFLLEDMKYCGAGILPENVHCMDKVELEGPFILQIDEVNNISYPLRERYQDTKAGLKRCLKLSLTDGVQHVFGMEYKSISQLQVLSPAGLKIIIRNVQIRRGLLLLLPEVLSVLGGMVDDLDAARQRVISEVNKPARGNRNQVLLPLHQRATLAAWTSNTAGVNDANASDSNINNSGSYTNISVPPTLVNPQLVECTVTERPVEENVDSITRGHYIDGHDTVRNLYQIFVHPEKSFEEEPACISSLNVESSIATDAIEHVQDANAIGVDGAFYELNPIILTGEKEIPFTYLACLLAKWNVEKDRASFIQGRIKCILTGVKRFQFKQRSDFELIVYVDDGSYISEVFIDHNVILNGIGYSPEDVTAALSSADKKKKADMTATMKKYQLSLSMFEGMILVEINKDSPLPVGLEMNQGCPASDAWLLLRRLRSITSRNPQPRS